MCCDVNDLPSEKWVGSDHGQKWIDLVRIGHDQDLNQTHMIWYQSRGQRQRSKKKERESKREEERRKGRKNKREKARKEKEKKKVKGREKGRREKTKRGRAQ